jgi:SAM-dependent methyltransferase
MNEYDNVLQIMKRVYDRMNPENDTEEVNPKEIYEGRDAFCAGIALVFRWLLFKQGIRSRQVNISTNKECIQVSTGSKMLFTHTIAEVMLGGKWLAFDPTCNISYGYSVEELRKKPELANPPVLKANMSNDPKWVRSIERNAGGIGEGYYDFVGSRLFKNIKEVSYNNMLGETFDGNLRKVAVADADGFEAKYRKENDPWKIGDADSKYYDELLTYIPKHCISIADLGCGRGAFSKRMVKLGRTITSIDISETAIKYAKNISGINAICGDVRSHELPDVDLSVVSQVLYYYDDYDIRKILYNVWKHTKNYVVLAHWCGPPENGYLTEQQLIKLFYGYFIPIKHYMYGDHFVFVGYTNTDLADEWGWGVKQ